MTLPDIIGIIGVGGYLSAYALLQIGRFRASSLGYLALNAAGSILILISLAYSFNLPSFISQSTWLILTLFGFARSIRSERQAVFSGRADDLVNAARQD